ncbi:hypothetical protein LCGC14_0778840 [marine sediment metagenome]|uniref:Uncharacterized protein n=1 Tax=marine sediment metagenome TaxID=412755 RepID=A0A0F9T374_9ZZZZ
MRAGMNPSLEKRLRRADPTVGLMVDAIVQDREDVKKTSTGWNGADSLTGLAVKTAPQEAGVELSLNLGINLTNTTKDGNMTDLDGPPGYDDASPFFTAQVTWGGTEPPAFLLQRIKAWLDPDTGGGQNVATWIAQLYAVRTLTEVVGHSGTIEELDLVPIMDPVRATAGASAGEVTFNLQGLQVRPKQLGAPAGGSALGYPDPITILFIWAAQSDGTPATNVGWARDSAQSDKTTAGNKLEGVRLTKALGQRYTVSGATGGLPYLTLEWSSYTTATISFTAAGAGNNIDLGAAPSNGVQFIMQGFTPGGTSLKPEVNDGSGWVEVRDGDFADTDNTPTGGLDLSVTGTRVLKQQTYDIRCQLITNATTDVTPKLTELGAAEATITDFANLTTVSGGQWAVDPVTLKGEITQIAISAIRDGLNDYRDKITTLLSENDIGTIKFRVWWGASDLAHNKWVLVDVFNVRDYDPSGAAIVVTGVSALAKLKAVLPVVSASASEPYTQINAGLQTVYDDLMDGQLGLDGQYRGPGVEDDTTTVTNEVSDSNVKVELDAIARCARGSIIASQGRVKFVQMFDDGGGTVVVFPPEELVDVRVLPGFRERRPEFFVPWNYNFTQKRYQDRVQITHTTAISKLGLTGLGNPPVLDDATARWVDSQALAEQIGQDTVKALATGLMLWSFGSTQPYPELEPGDRVTVPTERFVAKDPLAARALRGRLWVIGRVVQVSVDARRFAVWIQGYTDIFTSETAVTVTKFAVPEVLEIVPTMNVSREVSAVIMTKAAVSVKVSVSTIDYPSLATTQGETAQDVDGDGVYSSGTLATVGPGEQLFITALAYELTGGAGSESSTMGKAKIIHQNVEVEPTTEEIDDGWSASQDAGAPETGDVVLQDEGDAAYCNLEDANDIAATYPAYYDVNATPMGAANLVTVRLWKPTNGPTTTTWVLAASETYDLTDNLTDQSISFFGSLDTDWDLKLDITYDSAPDPGEEATVTAHGETHATPGVQYTKTTPVSTGDIDAARVVTGTLLSARGGIGISDPATGNLLLGAGSSAMTQLAPGAAGGYARSSGSAWVRSSGVAAADLTGTVASARLSGVYSGITGLGTQAQALDMGTQSITNVGSYSGGAISTTGTFTLSSTQPVLDFNETDGPTDEKFWRWTASIGDLYLQTKTDALGVGANVLRITRTGTTVDLIRAVATTVDVVGALTATSLITGTVDTTGRLAVVAAADSSFTGGGSVGVGTASPQRDLHIEGGVPTIRLSDSNAATDQAVATLIELYRGNLTNRVGFWGMASAGNDVMALATDYAAGEIVFSTGSSVEALRLNSSQVAIFVAGITATTGTFSGNMLIGTTTPTTASPRLDVVGSGPTLVLGDNTTNVERKIGQIAVRHFTNAEEATALIYGDVSSGNALIAIGGGPAYTLNAATIINFYTAANPTTLTGTLLADMTGVGASSLFYARGDVRIGSLGRFDSTSAPSTDFILRYDGSKWVSLYLHTQFLAGDGVSQINGDGTTSAFVYSNPSLSGAPSPNPSAAPVITASHKSIKIDMRAYTLGATETFVLDYSIDGGAYTTDAIISTGTQVVHATLTPGSTYAYKYKIRGGSDTPYSPASSAINPLNDSSAQAFGIVLAAQVVATNLAAISADIGDISAGQIRNAANTKGVLLSGSLPGGWTQYIDFVATGANPFIKHDKFSLFADGSAVFGGQIDITDVSTQTTGSMNDQWLLLRDPDVAHGMTTVLETDIVAAIGEFSDTRGGLWIQGFMEASAAAIGVHLSGIIDTGSGMDAAVVVSGWKKSGTSFGAMATTDVVFTIRPGAGSDVFAITAAGDITGPNDLTLSGDFNISERSPATFTDHVVDYDTGTTTVQRLDGGANSRNITGFAGGRAGRLISIVNVGGNFLNLGHEHVSSAAANRIIVPNGSSYNIGVDSSVFLWYDSTASRWRVIGPIV